MQVLRSLLLATLLLASLLPASAQNQFPSPSGGPYSYIQNIVGYVPGVVGPREANHGIYNTLQRGEEHSMQCTYSRATTYDQNVVNFHWTKPIPRTNNVPNLPAATNYVIIVQTGAPVEGYYYDNIDYSATYIADLPFPLPQGNGTLSSASEVFRRTPYQCPACGPLAEPRRYFVLKSGSYLTNPNDTTAVFTNAKLGERYWITRYDYLADAAGIPTNPAPNLYATFLYSRPIALNIPRATPAITGITTDAAGHFTVTWNRAVEDPNSHGMTAIGTTSVAIPATYTVRVTEDDSVRRKVPFMVGEAGIRNAPFAAGSQYSYPANYKYSDSAPVTASTAPTAATYSFTFNRATDVVARAGHYYSFQVSSNDYSHGQYAGDSPISSIVTPSDPAQWLAVNLTSFNAVRTSATNVSLTWSTSRELDNLGFDVQRSTDGGLTWSKLAFVAGASVSVAPRSYSFQDFFQPAAHYRLAQRNSSLLVTTYTGAQAVPLFTTLATTAAAAAPALTASPNPASSTVALNGLDATLPVQLRNPLGQLLAEYPAGTRELNVSGRTAGLYLLQQGPRTVRLVVQ